MRFPSTDFKSVASTISPRRHDFCCNIFKPPAQWRVPPQGSSVPFAGHRLARSRMLEAKQFASCATETRHGGLSSFIIALFYISVNFTLIDFSVKIKSMANNSKTIQEIEKLLAQNFIFDAYFKSEIKKKIPALNGAQLTKLLDALTEADDFQRETLADKIRKDKNFYRRVIAEKKKFDEAVLITYKKKMEKHDKNKIGALLARLKNF